MYDTQSFSFIIFVVDTCNICFTERHQLFNSESLYFESDTFVVITPDITTVGVTVTLYCSCNSFTADTVGLGCMPFLLSHLVIFFLLMVVTVGIFFFFHLYFLLFGDLSVVL